MHPFFFMPIRKLVWLIQICRGGKSLVIDLTHGTRLPWTDHCVGSWNSGPWYRVGVDGLCSHWRDLQGVAIQAALSVSLPVLDPGPRLHLGWFPRTLLPGQLLEGCGASRAPVPPRTLIPDLGDQPKRAGLPMKLNLETFKSRRWKLSTNHGCVPSLDNFNMFLKLCR